MTSFVHSVVTAFLRLVTRVFFRQIEVAGLENVPERGPVIFVGNHPNSLVDPVLVTTTCGRAVRFAAKDTLWQNPILRPFLAALGSVPVRRRMDHAGASSLDNDSAFDELHKVLEAGGAFGIFPEGLSHISSELAPLKTGAARIALGAAAKGIAVRIVPVGLNYVRQRRMRSRALVQFGPPLETDGEIVSAWKEDAREASHALTGRIEDALRALTINAPDFETIRVLEGARRLYTPPGHALTLAERVEITRRLIEHWRSVRDVPEVAALYRDIDEYLFELRAFGVSDAALAREVSRRVYVRHLVGHLLLLLFWAPIALPAMLLHAPVLVLAIYAGEGLNRRDDVTATVKILVATFGTLLTYTVIVGIVFASLPFPRDAQWSAFALVTLLLSGWATIRALEGQSRLRRGFWLLARLLDVRREMARLRMRRDDLRERLLDLVDKYRDPGLERVIPEAAHEGA